MSITAPRNDESVQDSHASICPKRLPIEVFDCIITEAAKYWGNLKVYSRVCWEWNHICRPRLFRSMRMRLWDIRKLSFLHFTAPHLCKYPQRLYVDCGADYSSEPAPSWQADALGQFTNVSSLTLYTGRSEVLPDARVPAIMRLLAKAPFVSSPFRSGPFWKAARIYSMPSQLVHPRWKSSHSRHVASSAAPPTFAGRWQSQ